MRLQIASWSIKSDQIRRVLNCKNYCTDALSNDCFFPSHSMLAMPEKSYSSIGIAYVGGDLAYSNVKSTSAVMPSISDYQTQYVQH